MLRNGPERFSSPHGRDANERRQTENQGASGAEVITESFEQGEEITAAPLCSHTLTHTLVGDDISLKRPHVVDDPELATSFFSSLKLFRRLCSVLFAVCVYLTALLSRLVPLNLFKLISLNLSFPPPQSDMKECFGFVVICLISLKLLS